ncbi:unnamed protein product [Spirodela intermedia]|uniref:Phytocyanin domain-containing protein n=1 Tax=Spirodela intermedia TaxID=51605 RepID=A0A7I8LCQ3_SPIIN|nr:unnamed protein product [Spirodela intermedia]
MERTCRWLLLCALLELFALSSAAVALEFRVGGARGWHKPTGNETETYNEWARRNRFHIGDALYFRYENDSVLAVDYDGYSRCNTTAAALKFNDGDTTFELYRHGFFFFISGKPGHCEAGQKLVVRVMVHNPPVSPAPAPETGGNSGSASEAGPSIHPTPNAASKLFVDLHAVVMAVIMGGVVASALLV